MSEAAARRVAAGARIVNKRGLHARAAARFVKLAGAFDADVQVCFQGTAVSGISIMGLLMLGAAQDSEIEVSATGEQAQEAVSALVDLVLAGFGEG